METEKDGAITKEEILSKVKIYLREVKSSFAKVKESAAHQTSTDEMIGFFVEVRKSLQSIDYWTQAYKDDAEVKDLLQEANNIANELKKIEDEFNFDFKDFQTKQTAAANQTRAFSLPQQGDSETNEGKMFLDSNPEGPDFENTWGEIISKLRSERNDILFAVNSMFDDVEMGEDVNKDLFEKLKNRNIEFRLVYKKIIDRLNSEDTEQNRVKIEEIEAFFSEKETKRIVKLLSKFFKKYIKDNPKTDRDESVKGPEETKNEEQWPPAFAEELANDVNKITESLEEIERRINRDFDYSNSLDNQFLINAKSDLDIQLALLEGLEKNKNLVASAKRLLEFHGLQIEVAALRQVELQSILDSTSELKELSNEVAYKVWSKSIFLNHPELVDLDIELNQVPPLPGGNEVDHFNALNDASEKLELLLQRVAQVVKIYSGDAKKNNEVNTDFVQVAKDELDQRRSNTFIYWRDNLTNLYSEFRDTNPGVFIGKLSHVEGKTDAELAAEDIKQVKLDLEVRMQQAKNQVESNESVKIPNGENGQKYNQHLQDFWDRAKKQIERLKKIQMEQEEKLRTVASETARTFFEEGYAPDTPLNWREGNWRSESPSRLGTAIWDYVEQVLLLGEARETEAFMHTQVLGATFVMHGHNIKILDLCKSFISLKETYTDPQIQKEFFDIGDKLIKDFTQVESIINRGYAVSQLEKRPTDLIAFYSNTDNQMTRIDFERIAIIGNEYQDKEGQRTVSERLLWAQQAFFAMNEPDFIGTAWLSKDPSSKEPDQISRNVRARNPLTIFPLATASAESVFIKRDVIRLIAGSEHPPKWETDPAKPIREPNETASQFSIRKRKFMSDCIQEILYGRLPPTAENPEGKLCTEANAVADSFWGKYKRSGNKKVSDRDYLTPDQKKIVGKGHLAEQLSINLGEFSLEPCKAEGQIMTGKNRTVVVDGNEVTLPEVDSLAGPTSIHQASRLFYNQAYRRKLTKKDSAEGSPGPRDTLDDFYSVIDTQNDRYWYIPDGEREGVTLKEAIILADSAQAFKDIPWGTAVTEAERNSAWVEEVRLSLNHWDRMIKPDGLGITWHRIVKTEPGSGGNLITFDASIAQNIFFPFFRDVTYMMQRDKGVKLKTWKNREEWEKFKKIETHYLTQLQEGNLNPAKPNEVEGIVVTDQLWNEVVNLSRIPTSQHSIADIYEPEDDTQTKITRYASLMPEVVRVPKLVSMMDVYEKEVINNPRNSQWDIWKKLFIGKILIGSLSSSDVEAMDYKDVRAIKQLLSRKIWERETKNFLARLSRRIGGRSKELEYNGVGIFSGAEADALLKRAGVPTGLKPMARAALAQLESTR